MDNDWKKTIMYWCLVIGYIVFLILATQGCATLGPTYTATIKGTVNSPTGEYTIIEASCDAVQNVWDAIAPEGLKHLDVEAFTDRETMTIWYCTEYGLQQELENIQSYGNLLEAHKRDRRNAFPPIPPRTIDPRKGV